MRRVRAASIASSITSARSTSTPSRTPSATSRRRPKLTRTTTFAACPLTLTVANRPSDYSRRRCRRRHLRICRPPTCPPSTWSTSPFPYLAGSQDAPRLRGRKRSSPHPSGREVPTAAACPWSTAPSPSRHPDSWAPWAAVQARGTATRRALFPRRTAPSTTASAWAGERKSSSTSSCCSSCLCCVAPPPPPPSPLGGARTLNELPSM